jgi:hypothetical protein
MKINLADVVCSPIIFDRLLFRGFGIVGTHFAFGRPFEPILDLILRLRLAIV